MLGEEKFRGIQIYDVIQDKDANYYFATNSGLYRYDFYDYQKIECDEAKSKSVFNFVSDETGVIYCHNLNNQVFRIRGKNCELFYELLNNEATSDISLSVAADGRLIVGAKKIIILDKTGELIMKYPLGYYLAPPFKTSENKVLFHLSGSDTIIEYSKGTLSKHALLFETSQRQTPNSLQFFKIDGFVYAIDLKNKQTYSYDHQHYKLTSIGSSSVFSRSEAIRLYEMGSELWIAGTLRGISVLKDTTNSTVASVFYKDYLISDIYKDREGNILLSTFDKGILVVPDLNVPDAINSFRDDPVATLIISTPTELILGTTQGTLIKYNTGIFTTIRKAGTRTIEGIYGDTASNFVFFDDGYIRAYTKTSGKISDITLASLKDVAFISPEQSYLGTNTGVLKCDLKGNKPHLQTIPGLDHRIYALEYNRDDKLLFAASSKGLLMMDSTGAISNITYHNATIFPLDLFLYKKQLYVSTQKNGILVAYGKKIIDSIRPIISGIEEPLDKILFLKNSFIGSSSRGLFEFDLHGKLLKSIHTAFGFPRERILDFVSQDNTLWVSHSKGVQKIDLNYLQPVKALPQIKLDAVYVNGESVNATKYSSFKSNQRKVEFVLALPTLRNRENIRYHYKLMGYDNTWNTNIFSNNKVTYNALAAGDYTFQVRAANNESQGESITYVFSISSPFYSRLWFVSAVIVLFLAIVWLIYRGQLNTQRKKSKQLNELNASKLTAIQSQMNPHFIFNSLNSIQDLVLKGDIENSYSYITTFSNLVRRTLNYSDKDFIDFEQEIKLLELYLSLEKLRFKKDFTFTIEINNTIDIMIPPLLVQPFIENSLVHGLLHKEGSKILKISFELADTLICTVEDNGIGREKAKARKQRQKTEHESFSGKAIHRRFEILSHVHKAEFGYVYEDLKKDGVGIGTKVILRMPAKHKF